MSRALPWVSRLAAAREGWLSVLALTGAAWLLASAAMDVPAEPVTPRADAGVVNRVGGHASSVTALPARDAAAQPAATAASATARP